MGKYFHTKTAGLMKFIGGPIGIAQTAFDLGAGKVRDILHGGEIAGKKLNNNLMRVNGSKLSSPNITAGGSIPVNQIVEQNTIKRNVGLGL
jgi:hypothetical protein